MSNLARYHLIPDQVGNGVMIFDCLTGDMQRPACWQDLAAYYYYLVGRGQMDQAQKLLAGAMTGEKPIAKMLMSFEPSNFCFT
jgi:hypothetical protein